MSRLKAWVAAKAMIRVSFLSANLSFVAHGRIALASDDSELFFSSDDKQVRLVVSLGTVEFPETFEPLLAAPEAMRFKLDFFSAVALRLPMGSLDLLEVAE